MEVVGRIDRCRHERSRLADQLVTDRRTVQHRFDRGQPMRSVAGANHPDMRIADEVARILVIPKRDTC